MDEAEKLQRLEELRAMGLLTELDYIIHRDAIRRETADAAVDNIHDPAKT